MATSTELIPFHGDNLLYVEHEGAPFFGIRRACGHLGIDDRAQIAKLKARPELWGAAIIAAPSAGGDQETFCIPQNRVAAWLFSITPSKVAEHLRELLIRYQIECADVLDRHFRQRREDQSEEVAALRAMLDRSHAHLLVAMPQWAKIRILHAADLWWTSAARRLKMSESVFSSHVEDMQRCGILPAGRWEAGNRDETWYGVMRQLQYENGRLKEKVATLELAAFEARQTLAAEPEPDEAPDEQAEDEAAAEPAEAR